jgi:deoxyuridine 5'-triphosphate nucleotidohydrolase
MLIQDIPENRKPGADPAKRYARTIVKCDSGISPKCKGTYTVNRANFQITRAKNGQDICLFCARTSKYSGRSNPNCKYPGVNDSFFKDIDTEGKAYLLGWIASDGTVAEGGIEIGVHKKDKEIVDVWNRILGTSLPMSGPNLHNMVGWSINSREISRDVCYHLKISPGKKSDKFRIPSLSDSLSWAFLRGWFDGDGSVNSPANFNGSVSYASPVASLASMQTEMLEWAENFVRIPADVITPGSGKLTWTSNNALDLLARLYDETDLFLKRKRDLYHQWRCWVPGLSGVGNSRKFPEFKCVRVVPEAVLPSKSNASDTGYDLTAISLIEKVGSVEFYDTGIRVQPSFGWWFSLAARSSLARKGYILANCFGVIDRSYIGTVKIPLIKIDPLSNHTIELPCRAVQLVPLPAVHMGNPIEVNSLEESHRGTGGFGSTGT